MKNKLSIACGVALAVSAVVVPRAIAVDSAADTVEKTINAQIACTYTLNNKPGEKPLQPQSPLPLHVTVPKNAQVGKEFSVTVIPPKDGVKKSIFQGQKVLFGEQADAKIPVHTKFTDVEAALTVTPDTAKIDKTGLNHNEIDLGVSKARGGDKDPDNQSYNLTFGDSYTVKVTPEAEGDVKLNFTGLTAQLKAAKTDSTDFKDVYKVNCTLSNAVVTVNVGKAVKTEPSSSSAQPTETQKPGIPAEPAPQQPQPFWKQYRSVITLLLGITGLGSVIAIALNWATTHGLLHGMPMLNVPRSS